jgi:hypothetical protein
MARTAKSPSARAQDVYAAHTALIDALDRAETSMRTLGPDHADTLRAWEVVEVHGATIHRQSRLLAGKSRGG